MNIEAVREYCLSLPMATEDSAFGDELVLFRVFDKIFACMSLAGKDYLALKCDPDYALELRSTHDEIKPAYHWNKKYWNQVAIAKIYDSEFLKGMIRHSYSQVVGKLPKKIRIANPELDKIK